MWARAFLARVQGRVSGRHFHRLFLFPLVQSADRPNGSDDESL